LPPLEAHINLPAQEWENMVVMETAHESKFFDGEKYTEIYLPLRIKGKWIMLVADPQVRKTWRIMFDEWELNRPTIGELSRGNGGKRSQKINNRSET
jgi:hypothetical protein